MEEDKHQESERMDGGGDAWAPSVQSHRAVDGIGGGGGGGAAENVDMPRRGGRRMQMVTRRREKDHGERGRGAERLGRSVEISEG